MILNIEEFRETIEINRQELINNRNLTNELIVDDIMISLGYNKKRDNSIKRLYDKSVDWIVQQDGKMKLAVKVFALDENEINEELSIAMAFGIKNRASVLLVINGTLLQVYRYDKVNAMYNHKIDISIIDDLSEQDDKILQAISKDGFNMDIIDNVSSKIQLTDSNILEAYLKSKENIVQIIFKELGDTVSEDDIPTINSWVSGIIEHTDSMQSEIEDNSKELETLAYDSAIKEDEINRLTDKNNKLQSELDKITLENQELKSKIEELQSEKHQSLDDNSEIISQSENYEEVQAYREQIQDLTKQLYEAKETIENLQKELDNAKVEINDLSGADVRKAHELLSFIEDNKELNRTYAAVINTELIQFEDIHVFVGRTLQKLYELKSYEASQFIFNGDILKLVQPAVRNDLLMNQKAYDLDFGNEHEDEILNKLRIIFSHFNDIVFECKKLGTLKSESETNDFLDDSFNIEENIQENDISEQEIDLGITDSMDEIDEINDSETLNNESDFKSSELDILDSDFKSIELNTDDFKSDTNNSDFETVESDIESADFTDESFSDGFEDNENDASVFDNNKSNDMIQILEDTNENASNIGDDFFADDNEAEFENVDDTFNNEDNNTELEENNIEEPITQEPKFDSTLQNAYDEGDKLLDDINELSDDSDEFFDELVEDDNDNTEESNNLFVGQLSDISRLIWTDEDVKLHNIKYASSNDIAFNINASNDNISYENILCKAVDAILAVEMYKGNTGVINLLKNKDFSNVNAFIKLHTEEYSGYPRINGTQFVVAGIESIEQVASTLLDIANALQLNTDELFIYFDGETTSDYIKQYYNFAEDSLPLKEYILFEKPDEPHNVECIVQGNMFKNIVVTKNSLQAHKDIVLDALAVKASYLGKGKILRSSEVLVEIVEQMLFEARQKGLKINTKSFGNLLGENYLIISENIEAVGDNPYTINNQGETLYLAHMEPWQIAPSLIKLHTTIFGDAKIAIKLLVNAEAVNFYGREYNITEPSLYIAIKSFVNYIALNIKK